MADAIKVGDVADVTIKGVRIASIPVKGQSSGYAIRDEHGDIYPLPPQAAAERVAPAEWPPRLGDVWQSATEGVAPLFAATNTHGVVDVDDGDIFLVNVAGTFMDPQTVLSHGELKLVYRTPGQAALDTQVAHVRELVAELHEQAPCAADPSCCREHCPGCAVKAALDVEDGNPAGQVDAVRDAAAGLHEEFFSPAAPAHMQGGGCRDNCPGCRIEAALGTPKGGDERG